MSERLTKREILQEIAGIAGGLYIAQQRMTPEGIAEELDDAIKNLREFVYEQYVYVKDDDDDFIYIAGGPR